MTPVIPASAVQLLLEITLNKRQPENLVLRLYQNDHTPKHTDTESDYKEATFSGYKASNLSADSWTVKAGNPATATHEPRIFTADIGHQNEKVYGYYVTGASTGKIYWAERFDDHPYIIRNKRDTLLIEPTFSQGFRLQESDTE
jgi:hypothetical protein